jgi:hypothetical protein
MPERPGKRGYRGGVDSVSQLRSSRRCSAPSRSSPSLRPACTRAGSSKRVSAGRASRALRRRTPRESQKQTTCWLACRDLTAREPKQSVAMVQGRASDRPVAPADPVYAHLAPGSGLLGSMAAGITQGEVRGRSSIDGRERSPLFRAMDGLPVPWPGSCAGGTLICR